MASFLRRPSNNAAANGKKNIVRYGPNDVPAPAVPKPAKKGSFVSLLTGSGGNSNDIGFDNGVDPLGRLSLDSAPPPPPSPIVSKPIAPPDVPLHWTEELFPLTKLPASSPSPSTELVARVRYFLSQKDPSSVDRSLHLALYAQQEGEPALNAKLFRRFGDGLPLRVPGLKGGRKEDNPVPKTLRELLRAFLQEHDPGYLAIEGESGLDEMLTQAAEYGIDSLESELVRKYGVGLNAKKNSARVMMNPVNSSPGSSARSRDNSSFDQMTKAAAPIESSSPGPLSPIAPAPKVIPLFDPKPPVAVPPSNRGRLDKAKSEKPQTFVELDDDEMMRGSVRPVMSPVTTATSQPRPHNFFDDKSLRADLKAFYTKHDPKKLDPQKFEPIVQWAYKIGPSELNRRFEEKYGESLNTFIENLQAGRPGVAPGAKNIPTKTTEDEKQDENVAACRNYREAKPGKSFGVCTCGFSRVDHKHITSLLTSGPDEPNFNKAKPKIVLSKNTAPAPAVAVPSTKPSAPQVSNVKANPQASGEPKIVAPLLMTKAFPTKPVVAPAPIAKFQVKAEGKDGPCSNYRLDLEGRSFGVCKCGWSRPEHYKAKQQVAWAQQGHDEDD